MRLREWLNEAPFALGLSSGFFGFYAHTGMLKALLAEGHTPEAISGSSAGALVGGAWASGADVEVIEGRLQALQRGDFWDMGLGLGLLKGQRFRQQLQSLLAVDTFDACRVPFYASVFDARRRATAVISQGALAPAVQASCAVPGLFQPVWIEGRAYLDGGILDRPGLTGLGQRRALFHHLASRSPWRTKAGMRLPRRADLVTLLIEDLPRVNPFALSRGPVALSAAFEATRRALDAEIKDGVVRA
ncbi:patatin-like phospholipase family protein [Myxococcota bacterium]|nr:patatin-like phospholipase family protein [Myxococcota bacterium]